MDVISAIRKNKKVEEVSDERSIGNGVILTLKKGWSFDPFQDNRVLGEDTVSALSKSLRFAVKFSGPYDS